MNVGLPEVLAVVAGIIPAVGVWVSTREQITELKTRLSMVPDAATINDRISNSVTAASQKLSEEMRREDGRIAHTDGERDTRMLSMFDKLSDKIDDGFREQRETFSKLSERVAEHHATLEALSKHAKKSDPHFKIPTVITRSPPASESLEALDDPPGRYRR